MAYQAPKGNDETEDEKKSLKDYSKYSSIVFQMVVIIAVFAFAGYKLDAWMKNETQWVTALMCVTGVCLSIYQTIRQLKS